MLLLLLPCGTFKINPHIGFKAKGYVTPEKRSPLFFIVASVQFLPLTTDGSTIDLPFHNFDMSVVGKGHFHQKQHPPNANDRPRDFQNHRFYKYVHRMHSVDHWWHLDWNTDSLGPKPDAIRKTSVNKLGNFWKRTTILCGIFL